MVNKKLDSKILLTVIVLMALALSACSSYQFGDISRTYCGSTNTEIRAQIKVTLEDNGVNIDVDYCASVGLIDALADALVIKPKAKPIRNRKQ